jgi:hypothetical protein
MIMSLSGVQGFPRQLPLVLVLILLPEFRRLGDEEEDVDDYETLKAA